MISFNSFSFHYLLLFITLNFVLNIIKINWILAWIGWTIIYLWITWFITKFMKHQMDRETITAHGKAVLITECDTGFEHGLAKRLNAEGFTVYAVCRNPTGPAAIELKGTCAFPKKIIFIQMDVTKDDDVERVMREMKISLENSREMLWALINNAAVYTVSEIEWGTLDTYKRMFDVNVMGLVRVTRKFLPLIRHSEGRIINIASIAGRYTTPGSSMYSISKHAVISFSNCLRREMQKWSVKVITIEHEIYRALMVSDHHIMSELNKLWNEETSENIKSDYGANYYHAFKYRIEMSIQSARTKHGEVLHSFIEAVMSKEPEIRYKCCGQKTSIIWWIIEHLPTEVTDNIINFLTSVTVTPRVLDDDN